MSTRGDGARPFQCCHAALYEEQPPFGRALKVRKPVSAGKDIIVEAPVIVLGKNSESDTNLESLAEYWATEYGKLSPAQRSFLATLSSHPDKTVHPVSEHLKPEVDHFRQVLHVNGHSYGPNKIALFKHISFASHSCENNSYYISAPAWELSRLVAVRDLAVNEPVTLNYIAGTSGGLPLWPRWMRQEVLEQQFFFTCSCARCIREAGGVNIQASEKSQALAEGRAACDASFSDRGRFLALAELHLQRCKAAADVDDGPFHVFSALNLLFEFHINYYIMQARLGRGGAHLAHAFNTLANMYEMLPSGTPVLADCAALSFTFVAGTEVAASQPRSGSLAALRALWKRVGGAIVRDCWGEGDVDYIRLQHAFGAPGECPSMQDVVSALQDARAQVPPDTSWRGVGFFLGGSLLALGVALQIQRWEW